MKKILLALVIGISFIGLATPALAAGENVYTLNSNFEKPGTPDFANIKSLIVSQTPDNMLSAEINFMADPALQTALANTDYYVGLAMDITGDGASDVFLNAWRTTQSGYLLDFVTKNKTQCFTATEWAGASLTFVLDLKECAPAAKGKIGVYAWTNLKGVFVETTTSVLVPADWITGQVCTKTQEGLTMALNSKGFICHSGAYIPIDDYRLAMQNAGSALANKFKLLAQKAYYKCAYKDPGVQLKDAGKSLIVDAAGAENKPLAPTFGQVSCIYRVLGVPSYVISQIGATNSLAGMQKAQFGKFQSFWTYHPENGLNITFHQYK